MTAGPEADQIGEAPAPVKAAAPAGMEPPLRDPDAARKASAFIAALGGKENIERVDSCAGTRLRLVVRDEQRVKEASLKAEGIAALVQLPGKTLHLLADLNADQYAAEMRGQLAGESAFPPP